MPTPLTPSFARPSEAARRCRASCAKRRAALCAFACGLHLAAPPVDAATTTTTFQVTATVASNCIASAANLAFGSYDPLSASPTNGSTDITVRCTLNTSYSVALDAGNGSGATVSARKMTKGAETLTYGLYQDAGRTTVWGNTPGTDAVAGTGTGLAVTHTAYGRIPAGQNVTTGGYSDVITVSVNY